MKRRSAFHSFRLACLALALAAITGFIEFSAEAQEAPVAAKAQYGKAIEAMKKKDWAQARALLAPLWETMHTYDVASALGQAEFFLKDYAAGTQHMAFAAANVPLKEKPATVLHIQSALAEMKKSVGTARISTNKDSAEILADGKVIGTSPLSTEIYLNPGTRILEARTSNGGTAKETLEVVAGKSYEVALIVEKPADAPLRATLPFPDQVAVPTKAPATTTSQPPAPHESAGPNWAPIVVSGGLAVVALAVGTGFALDAKSANDKAANQRSAVKAQFGANPCAQPSAAAMASCQDLDSTLRRHDRSVTVATVSFIAGGLFVAGAVGSYFFWPKSSQTRVDAQIGPSGGSLILQGSF